MISQMKIATGPLRERNRQRTSERIIKAAAMLFHSRGYDQTTMDDIAALAEVSRATLFNYFGTKDALVMPFVEAAFETHIRPRVHARLAQELDALDILRFLFVSVYDCMLTVPALDRALKREFLRPDRWANAADPDNAFRSLLIAIVRYGQQRGAFRSDLPAEAQAGYIGALFGSVFLNTVVHTRAETYKQEIDDLLLFLRSGIQPA